MTLYFHLIKLGVHIGHSKIDWNPQLNIYLAGKTNSNYLIFNVNKSMFYLKRTLTFYRLLGLNNGSFVIYYLGNLSNYTDLLEGALDREAMIPHSYPFIYSLIKPGFFSNWKTNYKKLIKIFYKVIFYNQYFFISLMNKIYYDFVDEPKTLTYKKLINFSKSFENIINKTKNRYGEKLRLKRLFFQYIRLKKPKLSYKLSQLRLRKRESTEIITSHIKKYGTIFFKKKLKFKYLKFKKPIVVVKKRKKKKKTLWNLKFILKKRINFKVLFKKMLRNNKLINSNTPKKTIKKIIGKKKDLKKSKIKYPKNSKIENIPQFLNYTILKANRLKKKNISDNLMDQSFKMFFYNIYSIFIRIFFRRLNFKSNNLSLTPIEYKYFVRFLKFTLIFRYLKRINKIPNSLLLLNPELNEAQFTDFKSLKIAVVGILDSNSSVQSLSYFIPSNDDSIIILLFYVKLLIASFESGKKSLYLKHLVNKINYKDLLINNKVGLTTVFDKPDYQPLARLNKKFENNKLYLNKLKQNYYQNRNKNKFEYNIKEEPKKTRLETKLQIQLIKLKKQDLLNKLETQNPDIEFKFKPKRIVKKKLYTKKYFKTNKLRS